MKNDIGFTFLKIFYGKTNGILQASVNVENGLKLMLLQHAHIRSTVRQVQRPTKAFQIIASEDFTDYIDMSRLQQDLANGTSQVYLGNEQIATISQRFTNMFDRLVPEIPTDQLNIRKNMTQLVFLGVRLQRCMSMGLWDAAQQRTYEICTLTTLQSYNALYLGALQVAMLTARSLIVLLNYIHDEQKRSELYDCMATILKALRRVEIETLREGCIPLINDITQLLRARMEETAMFQFMRATVDPIQINFLEEPEPVNEVALYTNPNWNQLMIDQQVVEDMLSTSEVDRFFREFM
jgi:hypothetical protein